jgi:hypothetical protein
MMEEKQQQSIKSTINNTRSSSLISGWHKYLHKYKSILPAGLAFCLVNYV